MTTIFASMNNHQNPSAFTIGTWHRLRFDLPVPDYPYIFKAGDLVQIVEHVRKEDLRGVTWQRQSHDTQYIIRKVVKCERLRKHRRMDKQSADDWIPHDKLYEGRGRSVKREHYISGEIVTLRDYHGFHDHEGIVDSFQRGTVGLVEAGPSSGTFKDSSMLGPDRWLYAIRELAREEYSALARYPLPLDHTNFDPRNSQAPEPDAARYPMASNSA